MNKEIPNEGIPGIGDNLPPADANPIIDRLTEKYQVQLKRRDELADSFERAPEEITDDETAGKVTVLIKQVNEAIKESEIIHKDEKAPYLESGRSVDTFFKKIINGPLETVKKRLTDRLGAYQTKKAKEERLRREEEERKAREEAAEAEKKALEAKQALQEDGKLTSAIEADKAAKEAVKKAAQAEVAAEAPDKDMGKIVTETGVSSSHKMKWTGKIVDLQKLDLVSLRPYIKITELERAVNEWAKKTNGSPLEGAEMSEKATVRVR